MPDPAATGVTPAPSPAGGAAPGPQQPPMGVSPATGPTPNKGREMQGLQRLGLIVRGLEELVPLLGVASEAGKDVMDALRKLSKHIPPGAVTPAAEKNQIQQMALSNAQNGQMMNQMRTQGQQKAA